ncbi:MAG: hypothetical protein V1912_03430 [bacterium]
MKCGRRQARLIIDQSIDGRTPRDPQVVVMGLPEYERVLTKSTGGGWRESVPAARERVQGELRGKTIPFPEEVLRQVRDERDGQNGGPAAQMTANEVPHGEGRSPGRVC